MICVSIANLSFQQCFRNLTNIPLAELRLDQLNFSTHQIKKIFSLPNRLVATCRPGQISEKTRKNLLILAIQSGASYVDIEIETEDSFQTDILKACKNTNCQLIISYHNYEETPPKVKLEEIITLAFNHGADIVKVACYCQDTTDGARLLSLYDYPAHQGKRIIIGMGELGKITRVAAPLLGAPFTFAAISGGMKTAPGQLDLKTIKEVLLRIKQ